MEIITSTQLTIPTFQLVLLLVLSTLALLIGRLRIALLITYGFILYWGYFLNMDLFIGSEAVKMSGYTVAYFALGVLIVLLVLLGLLTHHT
ncbi:MAG: hypothetical protein LLG97_09740 [Deltaproteobacteria bacterium]|nr:hypothetical protein [Deltaproteobacteria bacterium]